MQYDQGIPQSHNPDQPTVTLERAIEQSLQLNKAASSIFLVKMIAKLERAQRYEPKTENKQMGGTLNSESTTTE